jgi:hypothetical protein
MWDKMDDSTAKLQSGKSKGAQANHESHQSHKAN